MAYERTTEAAAAEFEATEAMATAKRMAADDVRAQMNARMAEHQTEDLTERVSNRVIARWMNQERRRRDSRRRSRSVERPIDRRFIRTGEGMAAIGSIVLQLGFLIVLVFGKVNGVKVPIELIQTLIASSSTSSVVTAGIRQWAKRGAEQSHGEEIEQAPDHPTYR